MLTAPLLTLKTLKPLRCKGSGEGGEKRGVKQKGENDYHSQASPNNEKKVKANFLKLAGNFLKMAGNLLLLAANFLKMAANLLRVAARGW